MAVSTDKTVASTITALVFMLYNTIEYVQWREDCVTLRLYGQNVC